MSVQMSVENYKVIKNRAGRERSGNRRKMEIAECRMSMSSVAITHLAN